MKYKYNVSIFLAVMVCTSLFATLPYPGNENFHNVAITNAAQYRTNWITNSFDWSRAEAVSPGISYLPIVLNDEGGWPRLMYCHAVKVDIQTPNLRFTGVDRCADWGELMPEEEGRDQPKRTVREKTGDFIARFRGSRALGGKERDMQLAFNSAAWSPWVSPYTNRWGNINGPFYADGIQISSAATGYGTHSSSGDQKGIFVVYKDGTMDMVGRIKTDDVKKIWFSVPAFVYRLVTDGVAHVNADTSVRPRTAIGISQDKRYFYVIMCDGDGVSAGWSMGADFNSLANMLVAAGAYQAFNLDGGGSSNLVTWDGTLNRPRVMGRPNGFNTGNQRDNGCNSGIYYAPTIARIGTYNYDNMDFLVDDIADGEVPSNVTTVDVVGDCVFSAEKPTLNDGWTYSSADKTSASVAWESGAPAINAGATVTFDNIRFAQGSRNLAVAAGGKVIVGAGTDLDGITTGDADGLVLAGAPEGSVRVNCATAVAAGDVFGKSTMALADTEAVLGKLVCGNVDDLVAVAEQDGNDVILKWTHIIEWGESSVKLMNNTKARVKVNVASAAPDYNAGYKLVLTLTEPSTSAKTVYETAFSGAGNYAFEVGGNGNDYDYSVALVSAGGEPVAYTGASTGDFSFTTDIDWFSALVEGAMAEGGAWQEISSTNKLFAATVGADGKVRFLTRMTFTGIDGDGILAEKIAEFVALGKYPQGAATLSETPDGSECIWKCLVKEDSSVIWKRLNGSAALDTEYLITMEVDFSSGTPRIRYLINGVALEDENGTSWFDGPGTALRADGIVQLDGEGEVVSIAGYKVMKKVETKRSILYVF